jgi:hypothetical protein
VPSTISTASSPIQIISERVVNYIVEDMGYKGRDEIEETVISKEGKKKGLLPD